MKSAHALLARLLMLAGGTLTTDAANVTFGTGDNQFTIEFVEIGNPGNADDIHDQDPLTPGVQTAAS